MGAPSLMAPLWGPAYLIYMVERGALVWPVSVTLFDPILHQRREHDNDAAATFPHHLGMTPRRRCGQPAQDPESPITPALATEPTCQKSAMVCDSGPCVAM